MKRCTKCKKWKPFLKFSKNKLATDGLQSWCKECTNNCAKKYYQIHKTKKIKYQRKYYQTHKIECAKYQKKYRQVLSGRLRDCYNHIKQRCSNPEDTRYKWYGGRGIKCLFESFADFLNYIIIDLGIKTIDQIKGLQIDRINNDGHYEPGNIRFVTPKINCNNRRKNTKF